MADENDFRREFETTGYLSPIMSDVISTLRARMSGWFGLADAVSSTLQQMAFRNTEAVVMDSLSFEQKPVSHCVLLRAVSNFQGSILMAERGMIVPSRIMARTVLEDSFCIAALHDQPEEFLEHLAVDDKLARKGQATAILANSTIDPSKEEKLRAFIANIPSKKNLGPAGVAALGPLRAQYLAYKVLSNDAAHPSATSLMRHMSYNVAKTEWLGFKVGPGNDREIVESLNFAIMAALAIGVAYSTIVSDMDANEQFGALSRRYHDLPDTRDLQNSESPP